MSDPTNSNPNLLDLLDELIDGSLGGDQREQLVAALRHHPAARAKYYEQISVHALLQWELAPPLATSILSTELPSTAPTAIQSVSVASESSWTRSRSTATMLLFGLAVSLVVAAYFAALGGLVLWDRMHRTAAHSQFASWQSDDSLVAKVEAVADMKWPPHALPKSKDSSIQVGEQLKIESGMIELELNAGTKLVVEGPADWSVDDHNSVSLRTGKLLACVPKQAIGFTVRTPTTEIVDLGTDFAVDVDVAGRTDVEVVTGKVDVNYKPTAQAEKSRRTVRVTAGAAKRFSGGADGGDVTVTAIAPWVDKTAIGKSTAKKYQEMSVETQYAATVLADQPLAYWRLSDGSGTTAVDASDHGLNGQYRGFVSTSAPGLFAATSDRGVHFIGPKGQGWLQLDDFPMPPSFSIELWVRSSTPTWNTHGWFFSGRGSHGIIICPDKGKTSWAFYVADEPGKWHGGGWHVADKIDDRFHHYVCAYDADSDQAWMYFDGEQVALKDKVSGKRLRPEHPTKLSFLIGADQSFGNERCGDGWVDEVAIYPRALSAEAIRRHFQMATAAATNLIVPVSPNEKGNTSKSSNVNQK